MNCAICQSEITAEKMFCDRCVFEEAKRQKALAAQDGSADRDGNWMDKRGACKVCDGEIPHGHTNTCDIYKLECEVRGLREALGSVLANAWEERAKRLRSCIPHEPTDRDDFKFLVASEVLKDCARELRAELNPELKQAMRGRDDIPWWSRRERYA